MQKQNGESMQRLKRRKVNFKTEKETGGYEKVKQYIPGPNYSIKLTANRIQS